MDDHLATNVPGVWALGDCNGQRFADEDTLILNPGHWQQVGKRAAQVGALYAKDDRRRDSAYTAYCTAITVGAFIAPLVCGLRGAWRCAENLPRAAHFSAALVCCSRSVSGWLAGGRQVAVIWPVIFHFICAASYLYVAPVALALVSRAAPASVNAMMVGACYLGLFVGGIASGWLARFYEPLGPAPFWLLHMLIGLAGALIMIVLRGMFIRVLELGGKEAS